MSRSRYDTRVGKLCRYLGKERYGVVEGFVRCKGNQSSGEGFGDGGYLTGDVTEDIKGKKVESPECDSMKSHCRLMSIG